MQIKNGLVALGVISSLVFLGGNTAEAKSVSTAKKKVASVVVTVKAGDTLDAIAKKHHTSYVRLFDANKSISNPDLIDVGNKIRIPSKAENLPDRHSAILQTAAASAETQQTATYTTQSYSSAPVNSSSYYAGNGMWCTDYVHSKRSDVPIYGDASMSWIGAAKADGKSTGSAPKKGAVAVTNGHVAYVEKVNGDGSYVVSEMGWNYQAGNYNKRTVKSGTFGGFIY